MTRRRELRSRGGLFLWLLGRGDIGNSSARGFGGNPLARQRRFRLDRFDRRDEAISTTRQGFNETRGVGRIREGVPQSHHGVVHAVLELHDGPVGPELLADLFPADQLTGTLHKQRQHFEGLIGDAKPDTSFPQLPRTQVELENTEFDRWHRIHSEDIMCQKWDLGQ